MNIFTKHPKENHFKTWWEHCRFASFIGMRLLVTSIIFIIHGIFPFIKIPSWLNLMDSALFLMDENHKLEKK